MLKNYFIVAWRNLIRNKIFSFINIAGLAIGLSICAVIYQYVQFEMSYDKYNKNLDRLYRVTIDNVDADGSVHASATNHPAVSPAMKSDFPEVEAFTRLARTNFFINSVTLSTQDKKGDLISFNEDKMFLADAPFLTMFSYPLIEGNAAKALQAPNSVVITESVKKKFFGDESALGKQLSLNRFLNLTITGVMKDLPENSHLSFDVLVSFSSVGDKWGYDQWRWPEFYNYVLLKPGTSAASVQNKLPAFVDKYLGDVKKEYKWQIHMAMQPVKSIHLNSNLALEQDVNGSQRLVYFLGLLGIFILVVAWINYINLSTAKSLERSKEVGLRKVVGATRRQLIAQFFFDSFLVNLLAMVLAIGILILAMPFFEQLVGKSLSTTISPTGLPGNTSLILFGILILFAGTVIAGSYPALLLSSFSPAQVLKGKFYKSGSGELLRKCLVSFQYAMSIMLIAGTITMYRQLAFMQKQDLGYSNSQVLVIKTPAVFDSTVQTHVTWFKNSLARIPAVKSASGSDGIPGKVLLARNGIRKISENKEADFNCYQVSVDEDFLPTFGIKLAAGRAIGKQDFFTYNKEAKIMINEIMSTKLGFATPEDALHEKVTFGMGPKPQQGEIVGVLKNYHQVSLHDAIEPMMFMIPDYYALNYISISLDTKDISTAVANVRKTYDEAFPNNAFEYFFLDDYFNKQYKSDTQLGNIFGIFTGLAIVIACLGLLGLSIFAVIHRTKEVGIRKVLGASVPAILVLFSRDFIKLLLISYLIAAPLVYFGTSGWLSTFAYHISPGVDVYLIPLLFLLVISLSTVGVICAKAAMANPTSSLRQE